MGLSSVIALAGAAGLGISRTAGLIAALGILSPGVVFLAWFGVCVREKRVLHCHGCGVTRELRAGEGLDRYGVWAPLFVASLYYGWVLAVTMLLG